MDERLRHHIDAALDDALRSSHSGDHVSAETRDKLASSLATIADRLAPHATQLAPVVPGPPGSQSAPAPAPASAPAAGSTPAPAGASVTGRVGEVTRATLNAIDFPSFVASLIQGTFKAIVDASIQQMEAYAELLKNVAGSVDQFMQDNVTENNAKDYLADEHPTVFTRDTSDGAPVLKVNQNGNSPDQLPSFFQDLGFQSPQDIDDDSLQNVIVPATRRSIAEQRQQTLSTMVLMGINRVVVDDGEILAKLMFHIDASESTQLKFDQTKQTVGNMAQTGGRSSMTAQGLMVNTTSLNAQSDINVRADLTGQVSVKFSSQVFPLERFADSAAIQLINQNAKVPPPAAPAPAAPAAPAPAALAPPAAPIAPAAPAAAPTPPAAAAPAVAAQGLAVDPWSPRSSA
jgi:hypothetical protein